MPSTEGDSTPAGAGGTQYSVFNPQFWTEYFRTPCMKRSWLMGIGCSSVMVAHQLRLHRSTFSVGWAAGSVLMTFGITNYLHFNYCTEERRRQHEFFRDALGKQGVKEWVRRDGDDNSSGNR